MKQRLLFLFFLFLIGGIASAEAQDYNADEIEKLKKFLIQESAESGKKNYEQLGIGDPSAWDLNTIQWNDYGITWTIVEGEYRLSTIGWIDKKLAGELDVSGCIALVRLWCNTNRLTSLNVSGCTQIKSLQCSSNSLISLNVSSCTKLEYLRCNNNSLISLNVLGCTTLTDLQCSNNSLTSLDVSGCTALTDLYCDYNDLTSLNVSSCAALTYLSYSNNHLTSLDVSSCTMLTQLHCVNNNLTSLNVSGCTQLEYLSCSINHLTSLNVSSCTQLKYLQCINNSLTSLDVSGCTKLETLWCSNNHLTSLDVSGYTLLESLQCSNNSLTLLDVSDCTALTYLSCSDNSLTFTDLNAIKDELGVNLVDFYYYSQTHETVLPFLGNNPIDIKPLLDPKDNYSYDHTCYNEGGNKIEGTSFINGILTLPASYTGKVEMHIWNDNFPKQVGSDALIYTFFVRPGIATVILPQMSGITYDRKAGDYAVTYGSVFRFTIYKNASYSQSELVVTTSDGTPVRLIDPARNTYELTVRGNTTIIVEGLRLNTYTVNIESVGGCLMFPGTGEHKVRIWNDFTFSIRLLNEYSHSVPVVKVNGEELAYESYRDLMGGEYSYKVKNITEDIAITIEGIDRNATSIPELTPQSPKGGAKVWITPGQIHVSIDTLSSGGRRAGVRIYTVNGQLVATSHLSPFTCKVPAGLYIVVAGEETFKVSVK